MINELRNKIYEDAVTHGQWSDEYLWKLCNENTAMRCMGIPESILLCDTIESKKITYGAAIVCNETNNMAMELSNPARFAENLANVICAALSVAGFLGVDIDAEIQKRGL